LPLAASDGVTARLQAVKNKAREIMKRRFLVLIVVDLLVQKYSFKNEIKQGNPAEICVVFSGNLLKRNPGATAGMLLMGTFFIWFFLQICLTAAHAVSTIQTFVASAASYRNMPTGVTGGCIALH